MEENCPISAGNIAMRVAAEFTLIGGVRQDWVFKLQHENSELVGLAFRANVATV
jgi:hypothetical protein